MNVTSADRCLPLELTEHVTSRYSRGTLSEAQGAALLAQFGKHVEVEFPTPKTGGCWELTPKGWVGAFAVDASLTVVCRPKLPVGNLARMLGVVYDLPVESFGRLVTCATLPDLYDQLAAMLAGEAMRLVRQGLHHAYQSRDERRSAIRGRILVCDAMRPSLDPRLPCRFVERTADVLENRLVLWTLGMVMRSRLCREDTQQRVREAYRQFLGAAASTPCVATDCDRLAYDRLTERYRRAHALCRLFLDGSAPVAESGETATVPFLLDIAALYERFVARWLDQHFRAMGGGYRVEALEYNVVGQRDGIGFRIDLVIYDPAGRAVCVLDTKYKLGATPAARDLAQVGYYALLKGCPTAGLVYPGAGTRLWEGMSGPVMTFAVPFALAADLDAAGLRFADQLMSRLAPRESLRSAAESSV